MLHTRGWRGTMLEFETGLRLRARNGNLETETEIARRVMTKAIEMFRSEPGWSNRRGTYWLMADELTGERIDLIFLGEIDPYQEHRFLHNSHEKALRLARHPHHLSSSQSRDPRNDKFCGAIRTRLGIFSMSGLPEYGDEIVMLRVAIEVGALSLNRAKKIARLSRNPYKAAFLRVAL